MRSLAVWLLVIAACRPNAPRPRSTLALRYTGFFVEDVPAAVAFYEQAFGLRLRYMHPSRGYAELETGATLLAFVGEQFIVDSHLLGDRPYRGNRRVHDPIAAQIALVSDDLTADWQRAVAAGAEVVTPPEVRPWGQTTGYLRDRDGILVELTTRSPRDR